MRLNIKPETFDVAQRVEASRMAAEMNAGLRMEVWSGHTEFHTDYSVPVGKIAVWCSMQYKALPEYETTLESPEQDWVPFAWRSAHAPTEKEEDHA